MTTPPIVPAPPPMTAQPAPGKPAGVPKPAQAPLVAGPTRPLPLAPASAAAATGTGFTSLAATLAAGPVAGVAVLGGVALAGAAVPAVRRRLRVDPKQRLAVAAARWQARRQELTEQAAGRRERVAQRKERRKAVGRFRSPLGRRRGGGAARSGGGPAGVSRRGGGRLAGMFPRRRAAGGPPGPAGSQRPPGRLARAGGRARALMPGAKGRAARAARAGDRSSNSGGGLGSSSGPGSGRSSRTGRFRNPFRRGDAAGGGRSSRAERKTAKRARKASADHASGNPVGGKANRWRPWRRTPTTGAAAAGGKTKGKAKKGGKPAAEKAAGTQTPGGGVTGKPPRRRGTNMGDGPAVWSSKPRKRHPGAASTKPKRWWNRRFGRAGSTQHKPHEPPPKPNGGGVGPTPKPGPPPTGPFPSDAREAARRVVPHPDHPPKTRRQDLADSLWGPGGLRDDRTLEPAPSRRQQLADSQWPDLVAGAVNQARTAPQAAGDRWQRRTERSTGMSRHEHDPHSFWNDPVQQAGRRGLNAARPPGGGGTGEITRMDEDFPRIMAGADQVVEEAAARVGRIAAEVEDGTPSGQAVKDAAREYEAQLRALVGKGQELAALSRQVDQVGYDAGERYGQDPNRGKWMGQ